MTRCEQLLKLIKYGLIIAAINVIILNITVHHTEFKDTNHTEFCAKLKGPLERKYPESREHEIKEFRCKVIPDILVIGMEKCGTASLRIFMGMHPQIFTPQPLAANDFFLERNQNRTLIEYYLKYRSNFRRPLQCTPNGMLRMEKIANGANRAAERVKQYNPNIKLVAIVREPSERTLSQFLHYVAHEIYPQDAVFEKAISRENPYGRCCLHWSLYPQRIHAWVEVFGADKILILDGDKFVRDPVSELRRLEDFVGIANVISYENFEYNEERKFYCAKDDKLGCMGDGKGRSHPIMRSETRKRLKRYLRPFNEEFYNMTGRRFDWDD